MPPSPLSLPNSPVTSCGKIQSSSRLGTVRRSPRMRCPLKIELLSESTLSLGARSGTIHIPSKRGMNVELWQRIKRDHRSSAFFFYHRLGKQAAIFRFITMSFGGVGGGGGGSWVALHEKNLIWALFSPSGIIFFLTEEEEAAEYDSTHLLYLWSFFLSSAVSELQSNLVSCEDCLQSSSTYSICSPIDEADLIFKTCDTNNHFFYEKQNRLSKHTPEGLWQTRDVTPAVLCARPILNCCFDRREILGTCVIKCFL